MASSAEKEQWQSHSIRFTDGEWAEAGRYGEEEMGGAKQAKVVRKALRRMLREWRSRRGERREAEI